MADRHWTQDELLSHWYTGDVPAGVSAQHLADCTVCTEAWAHLAQRRRAAVPSPVVAPDRLRAQQQRVWAQIDRPARPRWVLVPVLAATGLLAAVFLQRTPAPLTRPVATISDIQLVSSAMTEATEVGPDAIAPAQALFQTSAQ